MQWEYFRLRIDENEEAGLDWHLDQLGAAGFEMCGVMTIAPSDFGHSSRTVGFQRLHVIFKRPGVKMPRPNDAAEGEAGTGWHHDPYGIHEWRHWNGSYWSEIVNDQGESSVHVPGTA